MCDIIKYYARVGTAEDRNWGSEPKSGKPPEKLRFDVFETFPFFLGKPGRGRVVALIEVGVSQGIIARLLGSRGHGKARLRLWWFLAGF